MSLVLVARAPATVWEVTRAKTGGDINLAKKRPYVNHYSFHIMGPTWGHVTIKMSGHPPFGAHKSSTATITSPARHGRRA